MKTTGLIKNIFLIPMLILILGLALVNCGDSDDDEGGDDFKLYHTSSDSNDFNNFGSSVALSGDWAVVGDLVPGFNGGITFYKYDGVTWVTNYHLGKESTSSVPSVVSVDIDGSYALLGDNGIVGHSNVHLYKWDGTDWFRSDSIDVGEVVLAVAISGTNVVVGAPEVGKVYFYEIDVNGEFQSNTYFPNTDANLAFGHTVDIDGNYAIVGSTNSLTLFGQVYIYECNSGNWAEQAVLSNNSANFGSSVAICGDYAIVGAPGTAKLAYIYHREGAIWNMVTEIPNSGSSGPDSVSVAISSSYALVGEVNTSVPRYQVHIYRKNSSGSWDDLKTLDVNYVSTPTSINVALDNLHMIVGAGVSSGNYGQVWFYE